MSPNVIRVGEVVTRLRRAGSLGIAVAAVVAAFAGGAAAEGAFISRFGSEDGLSGWRTSNYTHPGRWIDTRWSPARVATLEGGGVALSLQPDAGHGKRFVSGELRRRASTHHGRYEAVLRAAAGEGLNTAFFTYTGPHRNDPHDEIDFEFLGRAPTKVWINFYQDAESMPGRPFDLGFDASAAAHLYAIEWSAEAIRWYADGRLLHEASSAEQDLPTTRSQVFLSLWSGAGGWLGVADPRTRAEARYFCVSYVPEGGAGAQCSDDWPNG